MSGLTKRSFALAGHRTSVALEGPFWDALAHMAAEREMRLAALVAEIDALRGPDTRLASALRLAVLRRFFIRGVTALTDA